MVSSYIKVLSRRNFFLLWLGQIISQFGDRLTQMGLIGLIYKIMPHSSLSLAKIMSLAIIPVFIISPISGAYVDRWDKRKTMYTADFIRGLCLLLIPLSLHWQHSLVPVYVLIFLSYCSGRFFIPAKMAVVPDIAPAEDILAANSLVTITGMIAAVLGFGVGGVLVESWGPEAAFYGNGITFFVSSLLVMGMRTHNGHVFHARDIFDLGKDAIENVKNSIVFEIQQGFSYLWSSPHTRYNAKMRIALFAAIGSLYAIFIVFMQQVLGSATKDLGWLAVASGGGMCVGSILYGKFGSSITVKKTINICLGTAALHLMVFTSVLRHWPNMVFALASCAVLGFLCAPIEVALNTLVHRETNNGFLGRTFSSLEILLHIAFLFCMFIASFLAELMTPFTIVMSVSIILLLFVVFNALSERHDLITAQ